MSESQTQRRKKEDVQAENVMGTLAALRSNLVSSAAAIDNIERELLPDIFCEFANTLDEASNTRHAMETMSKLIVSVCEAVRKKIPIAEPGDLLENVKSLVDPALNEKVFAAISDSLKSTGVFFEKQTRIEDRVTAICQELITLMSAPPMGSDTLRVLEMHDQALAYLTDCFKMSLAEGPDVSSAWKNKQLNTLEEWTAFAVCRNAYWMDKSREREQDNARQCKIIDDYRELIKKLRDDIRSKDDYTEELDTEIATLKAKLQGPAEDNSRILSDLQTFRMDNARLRLDLKEAREQAIKSRPSPTNVIRVGYAAQS